MSIHSKLLIFAIIIINIMGLIGCKNGVKEKYRDKMIGIKTYQLQTSPKRLVEQWKELGINTVFAGGSIYYNADFRRITRENGIVSFIICPIFFNESALHANEELYAYTQYGKKAKQSWVNFICPSKRAYIEKRTAEIVTMIKDLDPDGISLDFIRYFVFWESVSNARSLDNINDTCFEPDCIERFTAETGVEIPQGLTKMKDVAAWIHREYREEWIAFKCRTITHVVQYIVTEAKKVKPEILFNLHGVPWRSTDFSGAIKTIAGQDYAALSKHVDYISPMCYSFMLRRKPDWIHSVTADIKNAATIPVVPCIQVKGFVYRNEKFTIKEFKKCVKSALKSPSDGIVFWSWDMLKGFPEKKKVIKKVLM